MVIKGLLKEKGFFLCFNQNLGSDCPQSPVPYPLPPAYSDGSELNLATFAAFAILEAILYDYGCERGAP